MKNYFAFIDESGNLSSERYFGLGMLLIEEVGSLYDAIKPYYYHAREIARAQKEKTINDYRENGRYDELVKIAKSTKTFELKFKLINYTNNAVYRNLVGTLFNYTEARFSTIVIDREDPNFKPGSIFSDPWSMYISYAATLIAGDLNNLKNCRICVLADDLTKPSGIKETFEETLRKKIRSKLRKDGKIRSIFNITRLESHSSLMLQLVDILLGSVMYDFKYEAGLISEKLSERQGPVVGEVRKNLGKHSLAEHFTTNKPLYFNVWKMKWRK